MNIGDYIVKRDGDYTFEGKIVSKFTKITGAVRYVVEDVRGLLMIMNEKQMEKLL